MAKLQLGGSYTLRKMGPVILVKYEMNHFGMVSLSN